MSMVLTQTSNVNQSLHRTYIIVYITTLMLFYLFVLCYSASIPSCVSWYALNVVNTVKHIFLLSFFQWIGSSKLHNHEIKNLFWRFTWSWMHIAKSIQTHKRRPISYQILSPYLIFFGRYQAYVQMKMKITTNGWHLQIYFSRSLNIKHVDVKK